MAILDVGKDDIEGDEAVINEAGCWKREGRGMMSRGSLHGWQTGNAKLVPEHLTRFITGLHLIALD
jgi:hypothetical protein